MIVAISGIRDLDPDSQADVELALADEVLVADELRFGGALGVDSVALAAAHELRDAGEVPLRVFVPSQLQYQPQLAREVALHCADSIVELGYPPKASWAYLRRNDAMLDGADRLLAFTDGRATGGTAYTIERAERLGLDVEVVCVGSLGALTANPRLLVDDAPAPIFGVRPYVATFGTGRSRDWATQTILRLKVGAVRPTELQRLAERVATYIQLEPELRSKRYIVPMPRRLPGHPSDLLPLAQAVAFRTSQIVLEDWLVRVDVPRGGALIQRRERFPAAEHARTLAVQGPSKLGAEVMVLDNVITSAGTMLGAQEAIRRDTGVAPPALAVLWSGTLGIRATEEP